MPPKKKNAYTYYVEERCRGTGRHFSQSFHLYSADWDKLSVPDKEKYFTMAAQEKERGERSSRAPASLPLKNNEFSPSSSTLPEPKLPMGSSTIPNMKDLILDVNHNVGEFIEGKRGPGQVEDIPTPLLENRAPGFAEAVKLEYSDISENMLDVIRIVSCIPVSPYDNNQYPINRPIEIAVEGFRIGMGHVKEQLFHQFVDPGPLPDGSQMAVSSARKKYHQIPAAHFMKVEDACKTFHAGHQLNGNYYAIYEQLLTAAGYQEAGRTSPVPLLTGDADPGATWACLEWLRRQALRQADREGLPDLPPLILSTVWDLVGHIMMVTKLESMENLQYVRNTFSQLRYHHQVELRCPFHQEIDSELCAQGTANDKIYSMFDILRSFGFDLPEAEPFNPPKRR